MGPLKRLGAPVAAMAIAAVVQGLSPAQALAFGTAEAGTGTASKQRQHVGTVEPRADGSFASSEVGPGRIEVTVSGARFESRDRVERYLLYRAALLANANGASWFGLLYFPGEAGSGAHPARSSLSSQHRYGHWQPHWNYYVSGLGWQPWHPERGATFWADSIDLSRVERYDVHAIIELGINRRPSGDLPIFDVQEVIRDLEPTFR